MGQHHQSARPVEEWLRIEAPELRIVPEALWTAVQARLQEIDRKVASNGRAGQRARDVDSHYLLPSFARCGVCGGGLCVMSRSHGGKRAYFYGCTAHHKRGATVCTNGTVVRMEAVDRAVLGAIGEDVLQPKIVDAVLAEVFEELSKDVPERTDGLHGELKMLDREIARLAEAIASGGHLDGLLAALRQRESAPP